MTGFFFEYEELFDEKKAELLPQGQVQGGEGRDLDHHCYKTRLCGAGQVLLLNGGVYWDLPVTTTEGIYTSVLVR